jgi:hypothetical protein
LLAQLDHSGSPLPTPNQVRQAIAAKAGKLLPLLLAVGVAGAGCSTLSPATREKWAATGSYLGQRALGLATTIVLDAAVSSFDRSQKLDFTQGLSTAFRSRQGELITGTDVRELVQIWTLQKPHWQQLAGKLAETYLQANPQTPAQAQVVLESIAQGLEAAK